MDKVWRFFRTVAWGAVGVVAVTSLVIPVLNAIGATEGPDWISAKAAVVVGGLTVLGAGLVAVLQALVLKDPITVAQRVLNQFVQMILAGAAAPVIADTLLNTAVNYGKAWIALAIASAIAALQSFVVNRQEASPAALTPAPVVDTVTVDPRG